MKCSDQLSRHESLKARREDANDKLARVHDMLGERNDLFQNRKVAAYLAGSLGRGDVGKLSDLDLFLITTKPNSERK